MNSEFQKRVEHWLTKYQTNGIDLGLTELLFYRAFSTLLNLSPNKDIAGALAGAERSKIKGRGMEFDEARHYQPGDDIRSIDWRVTARTGKTHTKVFREERERPVFVFTDFTQSMYFGTQFLCKSVQAAHLSSLITWNAVQRGDKVGGLIFNNSQDIELKPKAQNKSALKLMQALVDTHQPHFDLSQRNSNSDDKRNAANNSSLAFEQAISRLRHIAKPGALVYLISDFNHLSSKALATISQISRHCEVKALLVNDPMEMSLPETNTKQNLMVTNGVKRQQMSLGESKANKEYAERQAYHFSRIKQAFDTKAIPLRMVSAGSPLESQLNNREMGETL
jgi:uncharacterized protein (DUF58 family)